MDRLRNGRLPPEATEKVSPFPARHRIRPAIVDGNPPLFVRGECDQVDPVPLPHRSLPGPGEGKEVGVVVGEGPVTLESRNTQMEVPSLTGPAAEPAPLEGAEAPAGEPCPVLPTLLPFPGEEVHHPAHRVRPVQGALRAADDLHAL